MVDSRYDCKANLKLTCFTRKKEQMMTLTRLPAGQNLARWDALKVLKSSVGPSPRFGHSMSRNQKENIVLVFGGQTLNGLLLNDCWTLLAASASLQSPIANLEYKTEYVSPKHEAKPLSISILTKPL